MRVEKMAAENMAAERVSVERATAKREVVDGLEKLAETNWKLALSSVGGVGWVERKRKTAAVMTVMAI
jgi:hypothetical protein